MRVEIQKNETRKENWILKRLENLARGTLQLHLAPPAHVCTNAEIRSVLRRPSHRVERLCRRPVSSLSLTSPHLTPQHDTTLSRLHWRTCHKTNTHT